MSTRQRVIYISANTHEAYLLRNMLEEHGIKAFVSNATLNAVHFEPADFIVRAAGGAGFLPTAPRVIVDERDAVRAREIALQVERDLRSGAFSQELEQLEAEAGDDDWPDCPHCGRPRLATCPVCQTSATHFPAAFLPESAEAETSAVGADQNKRLVICSTCDEAFHPRHPARCEWCGHRFADGEEPPPLHLHVAREMFEPAELNIRVLVAIAGLVGVLAAVIAWFSFLLR